MHKNLHPHSALHLCNFLLQCSDDLDTIEFNNILCWLQNPSPQSLPNVVKALPDRHRQELEQIYSNAAKNPEYEGLVTRVADCHEVLWRAREVLLDDLQFEGFIRSLSLDDPSATHEQVSEAMAAFKASLDPDTRQRLEDNLSMLEPASPTYTSDPLRDTFLEQSHRIINDDALFQQLQHIVHSNLPINETMIHIYSLLQTSKPEAWDQLSPLLEQMQLAHEAGQYSSYEDYVQKNFLDGEGQQYLDAEIDGAKMEHMMSQLSMQK